MGFGPNLRPAQWALLSLFSIAAVSCTSAGGPTLPGETQAAGYHQSMQLDVEGTTRSYDLYVPDFADEKARPMVLLFHGQRGSASQLMGQSGRGAAPFSEWFSVADEHGIVLVIPDGSEGPEGHAGWNDCRSDATANPSLDDVRLVESLVEEMHDLLAIDRDRVFATGISNGGHLALRLAIERPDLVAAIAPIAAAMPAASACPKPTAAVNVLLINGTEDPFLPFNGGPMPRGRGTVLSALDSVQLWVDLSTTDPILEIIELPNTAIDDGSTVLARRSSADVDVWLYEVVGGGHTDPSLSERYGRTFKRLVGQQNGDFETAKEVWAFFSGTER